MRGYEPDVLARGLDVAFTGLNPASSAAAGRNFLHPDQPFWPVLHRAGCTGVQLQPQDKRRLLEYGCGNTAVVRRSPWTAAEVSPKAYRQARLEFAARLRQHAPRAIAFLGKRAFSTMPGRSDVVWGSLPGGFGRTRAWVLPNPRGSLSRAIAPDRLQRDS